MGIRAVDVDFGKNREADAVILLAEGTDLRRIAWLLGAELVAGECENLEAAILIGFKKVFKTGVLGCQSALAGCIDDEKHLSAHVFEAHRAAVKERRREFIDGFFFQAKNLDTNRMSCSVGLRLRGMQ